MSAPTISKGRTWASGETVTPTRLNDHVDDATLNFGETDVLAGRSSSGSGPAEAIPCTAVGRAVIGAATAALQRTALGLGTIAVQSALAASIGVDVCHVNNDALTYASTTDLDLSTSAKTCQTITLTGNLTLTTSNKASGRTKLVRLIAGASTRTLAFPAGWTFLNSPAPDALLADKTALLSIIAFGTADTDILASYAVQQ